ncbi:MAG: hypothetical protein K0U59_02845 [Gammaproteobacteria bacterium]|nr:hypothetical protein [Gammaproteobacteria bacterium]
MSPYFADFETFYDPEAFGTEAELIGANSTHRVIGLLLEGGKPNRLWREPGGQGGIKVVPSGDRFQLPARDAPKNHQDYLLRIAGVDYNITEVTPSAAGIAELVLVPYKKRGPQHGGWLRG